IQGADYWDGEGDSGITKPKFLTIETTGGSYLSDINLLNCPHQCISISSASDTTLDNFVVDVSDGDDNGGHNTDGFDVSGSTGITVKTSVVKNQDDCVAVNQGSDMVFKNLTCSGGHGLSLSVGQSTSDGSVNTVKNVTFSDCSVTNSANGIHIKTHSDAGTGSISDITYIYYIKLSKITKYGINIQEDYEDGSATGSPLGNIPISNLELEEVTGTMSGGSSSMAVYILCGTDGCSEWKWSGVSITNAKKDSSCNFTPSGYSC
ncbi:LOW QUALITY PROTEIN: polygalacturonase-like, partial [Dendroctonus ponderosae]|uniref:LOW QUALITY PROTEIN: polygalacturonase-like n=1 Tax=Dendroctonus ponderosae TaxID=77166 RepID=UPI002035D9DA